jgi:hypothetical protein
MAEDKVEELFKQLRSIDMANAKEELLGHLERNKSIIKCAHIKRDAGYWDDDNTYTQKEPILLKEGYTPAEYEEFLAKLDFKYDSGYGMQELDGTVWLMKEGTWLERGEYDGSEWWVYKVCPQVPDNLKAN